MTLREFNEILNSELEKFYKAKNEYLKTHEDDYDFKYNINVPYIKQKQYFVGDHLNFLGTGSSRKYHLGVIRDTKFLSYFKQEEMSLHLEEEVEIAIINIKIDSHKKSILEIENSDVETQKRWKNELIWHDNEVQELEKIAEQLKNVEQDYEKE